MIYSILISFDENYEKFEIKKMFKFISNYRKSKNVKCQNNVKILKISKA